MTADAALAPKDTRARIVAAALEVFRDRGFHGAPLSEVLRRAGASKSSLFHHFPAGKDDLALAAARLADEGMLRIVDASFADAPDFGEGCTTLCHKLAKLMEIEPGWIGCPVSQILFREDAARGFREETARIFDGWRDRIAAHGVRLGMPTPEAERRAETLLIALQGAWSLARVRRDPSVLRGVTGRLAV